VLWKLFGARGIEFAGFLGGLVNSTVTVTELASRVGETGDGLESVAYRGILLSVAAMAARNALILGIFKPDALLVAAATLGLMFFASVMLAMLQRGAAPRTTEERPLALKSPFSLRSALKFGFIFLVLQLVGSLAQTLFGRFGFYAVSLVGGFVSSASAVAAAALLAAGNKIPVAVAGVGSILASLASAAVNVVLVARLSKSRDLVRRVGVATLIILGVGLVGAFVTARLARVG
jgi:uncharacterized membrane protein (DUF4010 family)